MIFLEKKKVKSSNPSGLWGMNAEMYSEPCQTSKTGRFSKKLMAKSR